MTVCSSLVPESAGIQESMFFVGAGTETAVGIMNKDWTRARPDPVQPPDLNLIRMPFIS